MRRIAIRSSPWGLDESAFYDPSNFAFSNGVHVCELEMDPETGTTEIVAYHAVDDVGTVINPMIVEGQIHGGLAQGIGQALAQTAAYRDGQLLSASFMDYALPRRRSAFSRSRDRRNPALHPQPARRQRLQRIRRHRRPRGRGSARSSTPSHLSA
ncbi:MAG: hypothetical protein A3G81_29895 [Betaproteobacteria bacterium RIFCSPLOWO2_12_FULL_65_14]|nr:MAG: hypothetical protein A3G81_29895 [Betaproteobacteria bacterium RIFCSPLOWO2_12_FULL_65_14]